MKYCCPNCGLEMEIDGKVHAVYCGNCDGVMEAVDEFVPHHISP